jgi:hypothetical protein
MSRRDRTGREYFLIIISGLLFDPIFKLALFCTVIYYVKHCEYGCKNGVRDWGTSTTTIIYFLANYVHHKLFATCGGRHAHHNIISLILKDSY